jgi:hypothetical protein
VSATAAERCAWLVAVPQHSAHACARLVISSVQLQLGTLGGIEWLQVGRMRDWET